MKLPTIEDVSALLQHMRSYIPRRQDTGNIETFEALVGFVESRSAYIGQTSLYGYLKTRMGTRYTELFQDDAFVDSINQAKWHVYGACISDLTVFAVHHTCAELGETTDAERSSMAAECFEMAVGRSFVEEDAAGASRESRSAFEQRVAEINWAGLDVQQDVFVASPAELVLRAPVTKEFMAEDQEVVVNSILFRWRDVRQQFRNRAQPAEIMSDWQSRSS